MNYSRIYHTHTICLKVFKDNLWNNLHVSIWIDICRMSFSTLNNVGLNNPLLQISLLAKFPLVRAELYLLYAWGYANSREPWWVYVSHDPTNPLMYPLCFLIMMEWRLEPHVIIWPNNRWYKLLFLQNILSGRVVSEKIVSPWLAVYVLISNDLLEFMFCWMIC